MYMVLIVEHILSSDHEAIVWFYSTHYVLILLIQVILVVTSREIHITSRDMNILLPASVTSSSYLSRR